MKQILLKIAARLGLVSAHRYEALRATVKELQRESKAWQRKAEALKKENHQAQAELKRHIELLRHSRSDVEKLRSREQEFDQLFGQFTEMERALAVAREQLTAVEVKLDILEGAANVLDARTRTAPSFQHQPNKTGAPV